MKTLLTRYILAVISLLLLPILSWGQPAGSLDVTFNPGTGAGWITSSPINLIVWTTAVQPDGKIIIVGIFNSYNGTARNRIARLNADGSLDATFNPGSGANSSNATATPDIMTTAVQADGKIIIGGDFNTFNGTTRNRIARLNADGSLDATFNPGTGANQYIRSTAVQADGKIIIGGAFTSYNGTTRNRIARLNADGGLDTTFNPSGTDESSELSTIAVQADGKIIIGGTFTSFNGQSRRRIARLNADGSLDATFNSGTGANDWVRNIAVQADGKIIIVGNFTSYNGTSRNRIARLNADGGLDASFNFNPGTGANNGITTTSVQANGKIIIGGLFTSYSGTRRNYIARLNTDGSLDATFNPGSGANNYVWTTAVQPDGKIIIGGEFGTFNDVSRSRIARIQAGVCATLATPIVSGVTSICDGSSTILTSSSSTGNRWNTGDTSRSITINSAGSYSVQTVSGTCTSAVSNTIVVTLISPPAPQLAFDSVGNRCLGSEVVVSVARNYNQYRWNNGATTRAITVRSTGNFSAEVLDSTGCWSAPSRTARITFDITFCVINIRVLGIDSIEASILADRYEWYLDGIQLLTDNSRRVIPIQGNGTYTVRAIINGRTSQYSNPITITSAKRSLAISNFQVFPNPASGKVTVKTNGTGTIQILDVVGKVVLTQPATGTDEINISKLATGVYTVKVGNATQKLVVK